MQPPGEVLELAVRPEGRDVWATVRSVHRYEGTVVRVKQLMVDWDENFCGPANLYSGSGHEYGPVRAVPVKGQVAFIGTDYEDREAGSLVLYLVHQEIRLLKGNLGAEGIRGFMEGIETAVGKVATILAQRPLPLWSWSMRSGRPPWPDAPGPIAQLEWFTDDALGMEAWGAQLPLPEVDGYWFDAMGVLRNPAHAHEECFLVYRSDDLHRALEVRFVRWGSRLKGAYADWWMGPRYRREPCDVGGFKGLHAHAPPYGEAWLSLELPGGRLTLLTAPALDYNPEQHRRMASLFMNAFRAKEG
jgi:hypothetical protein